MERHDNEFFTHIEEGLMTHEITPENRLQNQIALATDLYTILHEDEPLKNMTKREERNEIMNFWTDTGYSEAYRNLENDTAFMTNRRLQGDIFRITPADVIYYKEHGKLIDDEE